MYRHPNTRHRKRSSEKGWLFLIEGLQGKSDRCDLEQRAGFEIAGAKAGKREAGAKREGVCDTVLVDQNLHNLLLMLVNLCYIMVHLPRDYERIYFHLLSLIRSLKHFYIS